MSLEQPNVDEVQMKKIFDFILKLANDTSMPDQQIIEGIVTNLHKLAPSSHFPDMIDVLSPSRFHSETKLLTESQKARLEVALNQGVELMLMKGKP